MISLLGYNSIISICILPHFIFKTLTPHKSRKYHDEHLRAEEVGGVEV